MRWMAVLLLLAGVARAEDPGYGEPIIALTVDYERMVHVDGLVFALYPDGHVIYRPSRGSTYWVTTLSPPRQQALFKKLPLAEIALFEPGPPPEEHDVECIYANDRGRRNRSCRPSPHALRPGDAVGTAQQRELFEEVWRRLRNLEYAPPSLWAPKRVVVRVGQGVVGCPVSSWPSDLPRPEQPRVPTTVEIDGRYMAELQLSADKGRECPRQAILDNQLVQLTVPSTIVPTLPPR